MDSGPRYRAGRPPHDAVNGLRIGALTGGLVGIGVLWALGRNEFWIVLLAAAVGGVVGYFTQRRRSQL